jgi:hypothetical protein
MLPLSAVKPAPVNKKTKVRDITKDVSFFIPIFLGLVAQHFEIS